MIQIIIGDNKEVEIKTTKGLGETDLATSATVEILKQYEQIETQKSKLVLCWVNSGEKLKVVKVIKDIMGFDIGKAKECVNNCILGADVVLTYGNKGEMADISAKFKLYDDIMKVGYA